MEAWPDLRPILGDIRWAVVGGVATRAFMPERMTKDLDVLVHPDDVQQVWSRLQAAGYTLGPALGIAGRSARSPDGVEIDILEGDFLWIDAALAAVTTDPAGLPILDLPYLIMMKLAASRTIDLGDITRMLGLASDAQLAVVRQMVTRYMPEDADDLETMIFLGKEEMLPPSE